MFGKLLDREPLRKLLNEAEQVCGAFGDLAETLCQRYGFERIGDDVFPDLVYDRDTGKIYSPKG